MWFFREWQIVYNYRSKMKSHPSSRFLDLPLVSWFTTRGRDNWGWSSLWMERGTFWQIAKPPKRDRCPRRIWFTVRLRSDIKFQRRSLNRSSSWKKEEARSQNPSDTFQQWNWIGAKHNCTSQKEKKKREGITNRPSLFNHRTEPVVFSLPRGDRLISPEIVSRKGMRGNKVTERWIADRSSPERKRARTDWPRRGYLPL